MSLSKPNLGYFLDDNCQALVVAMRMLALTRQSGLLDYVRHYLVFVEQAQRPDGRFKSLRLADGSWHEELAPEVSQGRAIWALGVAARESSQTEVRIRALGCLDRCRPRELREPRARALALLGAQSWGALEPSPELDGLAAELAEGLDPAKETEVPWALLRTSNSARAARMLAERCERLEQGGRLSIAEPQQVCTLVSACAAAMRVSDDRRFGGWAELGCRWFHGANEESRVLVDSETGAVYDGLEQDSQSAEALLAWLLSWTEAGS